MSSLEVHCERAYRTAILVRDPFPHYVIDNFLPPEVFSELIKSDVAAQALVKRQFETSLEGGKSVHGNEGMSAVANIPIKLLGGAFGTKLIAELFAIEHVSSMFERPNFGGYYPFHKMSTGGVLGSHVDHSFSSDGQIHVANCVFYASSQWSDGWGGEIILFDKTGTNEVCKVVPKPNRLIVFLHSSFSFHGVNLVNCPPNVERLSYYMDYYAPKLNADQAYAHITSSGTKGGRSWKHGTIFVPFCPFGKLRLPRISTLSDLRKELMYVANYLLYIVRGILSK